MSIQNINIIKFSNSCHLAKQKQNKNNHYLSTKTTTDLRFLPFTYPVSFGNTDNNKVSEISFEESVKKYFRFNPDAEQVLAAEKLYKGSDSRRSQHHRNYYGKVRF